MTEMTKLNVSIWPAMATVTLNVSPMSISCNPESILDIIAASEDSINVIITRFPEIVLGSFSEMLVKLHWPRYDERVPLT